MKKIHLLFAFGIIVSLTSMMIIDSHNQQTTKSRTNLENKPDFYKGMITIKVKEGFGAIPFQKGIVSFNDPVMDKLVTKFAINEVEKRFRHRPIPKESGLPDLSRIYKISFPEKYSLTEVVTAFNKLKEIEYAEPIPIILPCEDPNDPYYSSQAYLQQIMASQAWDIHHGENGTEEIVIGISDTGVEWEHPDLIDNIWHNLGEDADGDGHVLEFIGNEWVFDPGDVNGIDNDNNGYIDDFIGWDFNMNDNDPDPISPSYDHGTHCIGIAAARTNNGIGVASISWNVSFLPTQVSDGATLLWAYDGLIYSAENGVDVISSSWSGWAYSQAEAEVIEYASGLGAIIVAAAGNYSDSEFPRYPAWYPGVISVASVTIDDTKASYSNWGKSVDISAPGSGIMSTLTNGGYGYKSGTSMATPLVAGLLGLVKSYHPSWSNDEIIVQVLGTTDDIDNLNPGYENELGSGRINAYRALSETTAGPEELRLEFISAITIDDNGNGILEQGEIVNIDLKMWNRCPASRSFNTTFTISCDDPEIELLQDNIVGTVPYDSYFTIENAFQIKIGSDASPHVANFSLDISSDISITFGDHFMFHLPVMASGVLVWEGQGGGDSYSGEFISDFLTNQNIDNVYCTGFPETFKGFDMAFLSFGNYESYSGCTWISHNMADIMTVYLENGGRIYAGSPDLFGYFEINNLYLKGLFGIGNSWDGTQTPVQHLEGLQNSLTNGMIFTESNQLQNYYIDYYETAGSGQAAFIQDGDTLAIQNSSDSLQKTFCFSYCLAELVDNSAESSRFNLLYRILDFFEYDFPEGFVMANFIADTLYGEPPLMVNFTDWSLSDPPAQITSWQWDFNNDGNIDSWDQNPNWQYEYPGQYTVSLTVCSEQDTNTFIQGDYIWVNEGIFVYEGVENGQDYSGTFIKDFFIDLSIDVDYSTRFPPGLIGYNAVFLSYGNSGSEKTLTTPGMAKIIVDYLETGANVYIEGGDCITDGASNSSFRNSFSLAACLQGSNNELDWLEGQPDAFTQNMTFTGSNQLSFESIDKMVPNSNGIFAFYESDYYYVAVQGEGDFGQKTFCFSYALASLEDSDNGTREELLFRILNYFDIVTDAQTHQLKNNDLKIKIFPNPFTSSTTIEYELQYTERVTIIIFNHLGEKVEIIQQKLSSGKQQIVWNAIGLPSGIYYFKMQAGKQAASGKVVIIR